MMLRLVEKDGSVEFVESADDTPPDSVLVRRPFHAVLGSRYRLEFPELRSYRFVANESLPAARRG
jgi:hypothetical protein